MATKKFFPPITNRQKAVIHVAKARLDLDDENYRSIMQEATGKTSAKDLDQRDYERLMRRFKQLGFTPDHKSAANSSRKYHQNGEKELYIKKIGALVTELGLPWAYVDGMAKKMFGTASINWLDLDELRKLIAALNYHKKRQRQKEAAEIAQAMEG